MKEKIDYEAIIFEYVGESDGWQTRYSLQDCKKMMEKAVSQAIALTIEKVKSEAVVDFEKHSNGLDEEFIEVYLVMVV